MWNLFCARVFTLYIKNQSSNRSKMEHLVLDISEEPGTTGPKGECEGRDSSRESQGPDPAGSCRPLS